jgi:Flp pilus assembly pilin Flp
MKFLYSLANDRDGATAVEYGLIAGLIALAIVAAGSCWCGPRSGTR